MAKPFRFIRKTFSAGGSRAITLPIQWVRAMDLDDGAEIIIEAYADHLVLTVDEEE